MFAGTSLAAVILMLWTASTAAQTIKYDVGPLGGGTWIYEYTVSNFAPGTSFDEFRIYFEPSFFSITPLGPPPPDGWDLRAIQPDPKIPADGFLDAIRRGGLLPQGATATGFKVGVVFSGTGAPAEQRFDLYTSGDSALRFSGTTVPLVVVSVPEPSAYLMMLGGLVVLARRSQIRKQMLREKVGARCAFWGSAIPSV